MFIRHDYKEGELLELCAKAEHDCDKRIEDIISIGSQERTFHNTADALENALADYGNVISHTTFMAYVSPIDWIRKESSICEEMASKYMAKIASRRDIYNAVMDYVNSQKEHLNELQKRIIDLTIRSFRRNGMHLSDEKLKDLREINEKLGEIASKFQLNINENNDTVELTNEEMEGVPSSFKERLEKKDGRYIVPLKTTFYKPVMENAKKEETRKKVYIAYSEREARENTPLLEDAIALRHRYAKILGYDTHVDYETEVQMAKSEKTVREFLLSLAVKLQPKYTKEQKEMSDLKKEQEGSSKIEAWDVDYYLNEIRKRDLNIDLEKLKEYFPLDTVLNGMFRIYSKLLGITLHEIKGTSVWHESVKLFEIKDKEKTVSYFYMDLHPRPGKYNHAAAFTLTSGRIKKGEYVKPIAAIVANFAAPIDDKPSLLTHEEVTTFFHEFGHIMHQTLTTQAYSDISGSQTNRDFVEAPSQMLENWCWKKETLDIMSGHFEDGSKIPENMLKSMEIMKSFDAGYRWMRQICLATMDLEYHSSGERVNTTKVYQEVMKKILGFDVPPLHFQAAFGHLVGGYDAKYYGYIWSKVYAEDMFTLFEKSGLLDPQIGMHYRKSILEKGYSKEADELLREFLGREPSESAFLKSLGV